MLTQSTSGNCRENNENEKNFILWLKLGNLCLPFKELEDLKQIYADVSFPITKHWWKTFRLFNQNFACRSAKWCRADYGKDDPVQTWNSWILNQIKDIKFWIALIFKKTKRFTNILRSGVTRATNIYLFFHPKRISLLLRCAPVKFFTKCHSKSEKPITNQRLYVNSVLLMEQMTFISHP